MYYMRFKFDVFVIFLKYKALVKNLYYTKT